MNVRRSYIVAALLGSGLAACQLVSGLDSFEEGKAEGAADASPDVAVTDGVAPGTDAGVDAVAPGTVNGAVHFLASGSLELATGGRKVTVTANGAFTFPGTFGPADAYDVTVSAQPPGQRCWVAKGKGVVGPGVGDVDVRCALALSSVGNGSDQSTLSTTFVDMADIAPITMTTDIASHALVTVSVPFVQTWTDAFAEYHFAIEIDGVIVGETPYRSEKYTTVSQVPAFVSAIVPLAAGAHSVKARWRFVEWQYVGPSAGDAVKRPSHLPAQGTTMPAELDIVVLESVRAFDKLVSSTSSTPIVIAPASHDVDQPIAGSLKVAAPGQPSLVLVDVPGIRGCDSYVNLSVDGTRAAYQRRYRNDDWSGITSYAPVVLLDGGAATSTVTAGLGLISSAGAAAGVSVCSGVVCLNDGGVADAGPVATHLRPSLDALVWKAGTATAYASSTTPTAVGGSGQTAFNLAAATSITLDRASKVLVFMSASGVTVDATNQWAEVALFAGGARTTSALEGHGPYADAFRSNAFTAFGIVDLPAGSTLLELRARNAQGVAIVTVGNSFAANGIPTSFYGFGAVALE